jgi:NAD+ synthase
MTLPEELSIDPVRETDTCLSFIRAQLHGSGKTRLVLGMSGGLDSAVVAGLCVRAVGRDAVRSYFLPAGPTSDEAADHAKAAAEWAGIRLETINVGPVVRQLRDTLSVEDAVRAGNITARIRMTVLYDRSAEVDGLVVGTGNRTEYMLGYTTLHGDAACAFRPIGHLYKCQVRRLAEHLGVPEPVIAKPPSAGLWPGQTDEDELGLSYDDADRVLFRMLDQGKDDTVLHAEGFDRELVERVRCLVNGSGFKRRMPPSPADDG